MRKEREVVFSTKGLPAVHFSHSVAEREYNLSPFCNPQKGFFIMKNFLGLKKLTVRELCILGLLTALTVVLAIYCTFRIGNAIKIPLKFITVFLTSVTFGPLWGGVIAAIGDILNSTLFPVGAPLPQITVVEFIYGFVFGLFFYRKDNRYITKTLLCSLLLCIIDITIVSYILTSVNYFPDFATAMVIRFPATAIKFLVYILVLIFLKKYLKVFERLINK